MIINPIIIGITGPIASGKTTFCKTIVKKNKAFMHINADNIVHQLYKTHKSGWKRLKQITNARIFLANIRINKNGLADFIFSSEKNRNKVEKLIHPLVFREIKKVLTNNNDKTMILIESIKFPLERNFLDFLIVITSPFKEIRKRSEKRYNLSLLKKIYKSYKYPKTFDLEIKNNKSIISFKRSINASYLKRIKKLTNVAPKT